MMKRYDLRLYQRIDGGWRHVETLVWNAPYALCKGEKLKYEANGKQHFEYLKITKNESKI